MTNVVQTSRQHSFLRASSGVLALTLVLSAARGTDTPPLAGAALHGALVKGGEHAGDWLDATDFKSLAQSSAGLAILAELQASRSDDPAWQKAYGEVRSAVADLQRAAREEKPGQARSALLALDQALDASVTLRPAGKPAVPPASRPPRRASACGR